MKIDQDQTLLFIGDSITDCGRARPCGEANGLGNGYVNLVNVMLQAALPQKNIRILSTGSSGNRITDLHNRWDVDVLAHRPDWLSVMIGINDVWRQYDNPEAHFEQVLIDKFESVYIELLDKTVGDLQGLILMTPYYIETNTTDAMRKEMDRYGMVVKRMAEKYNAIFVDTQAAFCEYLQHRPTQSLCGDRVHPNMTGHAILAQTFLRAIEFNF